MSLGAIVVAAFIGFMIATFVFALLARWAALVHAAYAQAAIVEPDRPLPRAIVLALCQSIFHDAPWGILVLCFIASRIYTEEWAPWIFGGFGVGFGYMALLVAMAILRLRKSRQSGTTHAA